MLRELDRTLIRWAVCTAIVVIGAIHTVHHLAAVRETERLYTLCMADLHTLAEETLRVELRLERMLEGADAFRAE